MAKKSKIVREKKLIKNVEKYAVLRAELKALIKNTSTSYEDREVAVAKLDNLPKSSSRVRIRNRCFITGRPRGVIRRFKLSRLSFREMALKGEIPGVTKASW
jgi:small subunit ribosomal protein S14|tara:strand:+ start:5304 stop:5609 length:306 start_codon:yes stop_codon:yes gene_type:complete